MTEVTRMNPDFKMSRIPNDGNANQLFLSDGSGNSDATYMGWVPISGSTYTSSSSFTVPLNQNNYELLHPGAAIKFKDSSGDYKCGVVKSHIIGTGVVTFSGPAMASGTIDEMYAGSSDKCFQLEFFLPGTWDQSSSTLLKDVADQYFRWNLGRAYITRINAWTKTSDSTSDPQINLTVGGNDVLSSDLSVGSSWADGDVVDSTNYKIDFGDAVEIKRSTAGGTGDASDLSVSITIVCENQNVDYEPATPDPYVEMTIGPIPGSWSGLGEGVHVLVPTSYTKSSTGGSLFERWKFTYATGANKLSLLATYYTSYGYSEWRFKYTTEENFQYTSSALPAPNGKVLDRLFRSGYVQNGVTFTWARGGSLWGW